jgi:two-component system, chemotaxis family, CheB/CheR fusion protein
LHIQPLTVRDTNLTYFLITLEKSESRILHLPLDSSVPATDQVDLHQASHDRIQILEEELRYTKENLQATVEEMETTNEELQATNEELVASNEELQSTNEELH